MKTIVCLLIGALMVSTLVPSLGYDVQPLYGRSFNLFSFLTSPQALLSRLTSLTSKFAILQTTVDILSSQFAALQSLVLSLKSAVTILQQPQCIPQATAVGARIVTGKCLRVVATPIADYITAQLECKEDGGRLAEPVYTDTAFYSNLISVFGPTLLNSVGTAGLYVGITAHVDPTGGFYAYNSDETRIPLTNAIWTGGVIAAPTASGFGYIPQPAAGAPWIVMIEPLNAAIPPSTTPRGYICEYPLF